jgi:hypothetical protein
MLTISSSTPTSTVSTGTKLSSPASPGASAAELSVMATNIVKRSVYLNQELHRDVVA